MNSTAVVTGAAQGIGEATAVRLANDGTNVFLIDRSERVLDTRNAIRSAGGRAEALVMDVSDETAWESAAEHCRRAFGAANILVSNAYVADVVPIEQTSRERWDRQLDVNLTGAYLAFRTLLSDLRSHTSASVVLVSSVHAHFGLPGRAAYASTKAALTGLARQLAVEYGPTIRVNSVLPGPVLTAAWDEIDNDARQVSAHATALDRLGEPREVAEAITFLCSDRASFITGIELPVDGGWSVKKDSA